jgi:large subunit ribosomal protein L22
MGRATEIKKRTSHISVKLGDPAGVLVGSSTDTPGNEEDE